MDTFARSLLRWYDRNGRHDLPWQQPRTPYRVWISEVMLQQTQVATVIPYFERFVTALCDLPALAAADEDRVIALWAGLGYYRRARHLQEAAKLCVARHGGDLPREFDALAALPGIGRSTAGAILALAFGQRHAILDGNVKRVLARFHEIRGWAGERIVEYALWGHADAHTPAARIADYTQAIMDLGATVCTRNKPRCAGCPQVRACRAYREGRVGEIPAPRPARTLPDRRTIFILLRDRHGRVLLQRRPPQGVWPGLWSLPEASDADTAHELASRLAEIEGSIAVVLPDVRHTFTHFRLHASPLEWRGVRARQGIEDDSRSRWCSRQAIAALGVPAPVKRFLIA